MRNTTTGSFCASMPPRRCMMQPGLSVTKTRDGLVESDIEEAQLKQQMVSGSTVVVGIVDSSKFGTTAFNVFALPQELDRIITDENAPTAIIDGLRAQGVRVDPV
ncbi:MAG: hypothetical protein WCD37_05785 [Chloroflexia bacterium]